MLLTKRLTHDISKNRRMIQHVHGKHRISYEVIGRSHTQLKPSTPKQIIYESCYNDDK